MKKIIVLLIMLICLCGCESKQDKYVVGVLQYTQHEALDAATQGFKDTLEKEFNDNVIVEIENASGDGGTCSLIASNFVAENVNLIMANATPALQAVAHATDSIPVLGTSVTEYGVALDIDNFDGLTNCNVSGTSDLAPLDEQAQMIIDLIPGVKKVGLLYCSSEANSLYQIKVVEEYLNSKGIQTERFSFSESNEVSSVSKSANDYGDAIYIPTDNTCASFGTVIANEVNIPIITGEKDTCIVCEGIATLSIDYYELGVLTGEMAIKVLKGETNIKDMKIEYYPNPVKMYIEKNADKYGINIPSDYVKIEG